MCVNRSGGPLRTAIPKAPENAIRRKAAKNMQGLPANWHKRKARIIRTLLEGAYNWRAHVKPVYSYLGFILLAIIFLFVG